jgi:hypothetical protein
VGQIKPPKWAKASCQKQPDDNPTVGIILCTQKDASVVRYSVLHENEQIFASRYKLVLPSEEELRKELERERAQISNFSDREVSWPQDCCT